MKKIFLTIALGLCACAMMAVPPSKKGAVSVRTVKNERVVTPPAPAPVPAPTPAPAHPKYVVKRATSQQVTDIVRVLKKEISSSRKLDIAKLCVTLCPVSVDGLAKMGETFSFDSDRLEFYKFAYDYCPDNERYLFLKDTFNSSSYSRNFVDFVAKMQR